MPRWWPVAPPPEVSGRGDKYFLSVGTKIDIPGATSRETFGVSAKTGAGLPELTRRLADIASDALGGLVIPGDHARTVQAPAHKVHALTARVHAPAGGGK